MQTSLKWKNSGVGRQGAAEEGTAHLADESSLQRSANYNNWRSRTVSNKKAILKIEALVEETYYSNKCIADPNGRVKGQRENT